MEPHEAGILRIQAQMSIFCRTSAGVTSRRDQPKGILHLCGVLKLLPKSSCCFASFLASNLGKWTSLLRSDVAPDAALLAVVPLLSAPPSAFASDHAGRSSSCCAAASNAAPCLLTSDPSGRSPDAGLLITACSPLKEALRSYAVSEVAAPAGLKLFDSSRGLSSCCCSLCSSESGMSSPPSGASRLM